MNYKDPRNATGMISSIMKRVFARNRRPSRELRPAEAAYLEERTSLSLIGSASVLIAPPAPMIQTTFALSAPAVTTAPSAVLASDSTLTTDTSSSTTTQPTTSDTTPIEEKDQIEVDPAPDPPPTTP